MIPEGNFKPLPEYEDCYLISDTGLVWSIKKQKFLKPQITRDGYLTVNLCKNGTEKVRKIHRLVALTFIPNPDKLPQINHKDENKKNNCVDNLEWCTMKYNNNYGTHNERLAKTKGQPVLCIETGIIYGSLADAERKTGTFKSSIYRVCKGLQNTAGKCHWEYVDRPES